MGYLEALNEVQKQAVTHTEGPVMVLAGAGSGKTRVLTFRVAYLMEQGVDPYNILALTFTNKAAREMKARIGKIVGESMAKSLWMGTFHSIFARILRHEADKIGYPSNFTIYDTDDAKNLLKSIVKELKLDDKVYKPNLVLNRISSAKNNLMSAEVYCNDSIIHSDDVKAKKPEMGRIYTIYEKRCFKAGAMDFDDLLFKTNILFRDSPEALIKYQDKFRYILVDEFQDTNFSQNNILKMLAARHENICVVGDDAQSIYAFRGANIGNILNFKKQYADTKVFKLEQNYRSTKTIVAAANEIIANNKEQLKKEVWTGNAQGDKIKVVRCLSDNEEGAFIASTINELKAQNSINENQFAILYRTNAQSRALEEALRKRNIPYIIYGGISFYQRKEVKDLVAYFRMVLNPHDEEALKRVINYPARGIGQTTKDKIAIAASEEGKSLWDIISNLDTAFLPINSGTKAKIESFVNLIRGFQAMNENADAFELGSQIASTTGILKELYVDKSPEGVSRYENIQELLSAMKEFTEVDRAVPGDEVPINTRRSLAEFMEDIALLTDVDMKDKDNDGKPKVSLMTVHSAKGLEFPFVFISGMEEDLFPSQLSVNSRRDLEEERRLFYVALTRAERQAILTYASTRFRFGNLNHCEPSRFLSEINTDLVEAPAAPTFSGGGNSGKLNFELNRNISQRRLIKPDSRSGGSTDVSGLEVGKTVKHDRFGIGELINLEGDPANLKATVKFKAAGTKQLLLKFAKLEVL